MFPELEIREGWVTVVCLLLMTLCVAWAIQAADWAEGLSIIQFLVLGGGLTGIVLAKSRSPNRLAHLLSLLAGWTTGTYLTSQVLARETGLRGTLAVFELQSRFEGLFSALFTEGAAADNHVFLFLVSVLLWLMAYVCAWAIFRWQQVWVAVIVSGVSLLVNISSTAVPQTGYLILFLVLSLLLVVRANLALREREWRAARTGYSPELISVFLRTGLALSVVVILLAWLAPVALASRPLQPFWEKVSEPWRRLQEQSARIFRDLNYQNEPPLISLGDRRMWFGGPVELTDTPIADVLADEGRYWRVLVFHEYTGDGWLSNDPDIILVGSNESDLAVPDLEMRSELTQTIAVYRDWQPADALIAAGQPLRAAMPMRAAVSLVSSGEEDVADGDAVLASSPSLGDPSALYAQRSLAAGSSYRIWSAIPHVYEDSLRDAGTDYPGWVVPRYLQLPETLPDRVRLLAEQVVEGKATPYDQAKAIERYLRQFEYDEQIEGPGFAQDGVDYFLFDRKAGYCDYYASSMVVMLRAIGVPARYVRGYSERARDQGVYHLLESDGHAWPEVYFPGYGWIEFEPTGGEPPLNRPASLDQAGGQAPGADAGPDERNDLEDMIDMERAEGLLDPLSQSGQRNLWQRLGWWRWLGLALVVLSTAGAVFLGIRRRRQIEGLSIAERVYEDLVNRVRRLLGIEPLVHQTPNEYAAVVAEHVPRGQKAVDQITQYYVAERFGGKAIPGARAEEAWSSVRPDLWRSWLRRRLGAWQRFWWRLVPPKRRSDSS